MRIGLLTTSFPQHAHDGAGLFVLGFARALAARGHVIEVLAPEPQDAAGVPAWPGIDVRWVRYAPPALTRTFYRAGVPDNVRRDVLAWPGLASFPFALWQRARVASARWDAVISHWALPSALVASALPRALPHVAVLHSADLHALSRLPARSWWAQRIAANAGALVFVCHAHRRRFASWLPVAARERFERRAHIQPMGFELPVLGDREQARRMLGMKGPTLLSLGRLVPVKGLVEAIEALAGQPIEWWIAGAGPERIRIERVAAATGARVRLLGHVHGAHKEALLCGADAFAAPARVLASGRSEGMPTAVLEAMAYGLPVIAADAGGMGDLIEDDRTGLLTAANDIAGFARAVAKLMADAALRARLGAAAREAATQHAWPRIAPRIEAWLDAARAHAGDVDARCAVAATS